MDQVIKVIQTSLINHLRTRLIPLWDPIQNMPCQTGTPTLPLPYLYNYAGAPWKTQYHVRKIMDQLYTPYPDGLCGDEDNGQTSAWYVFSALGMYPVTPGVDQYAIGSPLFEKATLELENGKQFVIEAGNNSHDNVYIGAAELNGGSYCKNYIMHEDIMNGGSLVFSMTGKANTTRGTSQEDAPFSVSSPSGLL